MVSLSANYVLLLKSNCVFLGVIVYNYGKFVTVFSVVKSLATSNSILKITQSSPVRRTFTISLPQRTHWFSSCSLIL